MKFWFILIVTFFIACAPDKNTSNFLYVNSLNGIILREKPSADSEKLKVINYSTPVLILEESPTEMKISGKSGKWVRVKYSPIQYPDVQSDNTEFTGWIFSAFLTNATNIQLALVNKYETENGCYKVNRKNFPKDFKSGMIGSCTGEEYSGSDNGCMDIKLYPDHGVGLHESDWISRYGSWQIEGNRIKISTGHETTDQDSRNVCEQRCREENLSRSKLEECEEGCWLRKRSYEISISENGEVYVTGDYIGSADMGCMRPLPWLQGESKQFGISIR
ncbi:SH3 domain-containing protein [Leptospira koniambonensis]|uniref:SH3 domain-containing protein n=1 Tax=Leptospira koniambonensis TaxID=2484950 RepID=UPI003EBF5E79